MSTQTTKQTFGPSRLEADVTFSDGTVHRITGLGAVEYHKDPERVGPQLERQYRNFCKRQAIANDLKCQGFGAGEAWRRANLLSGRSA